MIKKFVFSLCVSSLLVDIQPLYAHASTEDNLYQASLIYRLIRLDQIVWGKTGKSVKRQEKSKKRQARWQKRQAIRQTNLKEQNLRRQTILKSIIPIRISPHVQKGKHLFPMREENRIPFPVVRPEVKLEAEKHVRREKERYQKAEQRRLVEEQEVEGLSLTREEHEFIKNIAEEQVQELRIVRLGAAAGDHTESIFEFQSGESWTPSNDSLEKAMEASPKHKIQHISRTQALYDVYLDSLLQAWKNTVIGPSRKPWKELFEEEEIFNNRSRREREAKMQEQFPNLAHHKKREAQHKKAIPWPNENESWYQQLEVPKDNGDHQQVDSTQQEVLSQAVTIFNGSDGKEVEPLAPTVAASYRLTFCLPSNPIKIPTPQINVSPQPTSSVVPSLKGNPGSQALIVYPRTEYKMEFSTILSNAIPHQGFEFRFDPLKATTPIEIKGISEPKLSAAPRLLLGGNFETQSFHRSEKSVKQIVFIPEKLPQNSEDFTKDDSVMKILIGNTSDRLNKKGKLYSITYVSPEDILESDRFQQENPTSKFFKVINALLEDQSSFAKVVFDFTNCDKDYGTFMSKLITEFYPDEGIKFALSSSSENVQSNNSNSTETSSPTVSMDSPIASKYTNLADSNTPPPASPSSDSLSPSPSNYSNLADSDTPPPTNSRSPSPLVYTKLAGSNLPSTASQEEGSPPSSSYSNLANSNTPPPVSPGSASPSPSSYTSLANSDTPPPSSPVERKARKLKVRRMSLFTENNENTPPSSHPNIIKSQGSKPAQALEGKNQPSKIKNEMY